MNPYINGSVAGYYSQMYQKVFFDGYGYNFFFGGYGYYEYSVHPVPKTISLGSLIGIIASLLFFLPIGGYCLYVNVFKQRILRQKREMIEAKLSSHELVDYESNSASPVKRHERSL